MPTRQRRRSRVSFLILPLLLTLLATYFGWQSTRGAFSHEAREILGDERINRETELASLVAEREHLEARVKRLRTDALDADLLDERARAKLNLAFENEVVIFHHLTENAGPVLAAHN